FPRIGRKPDVKPWTLHARRKGSSRIFTEFVDEIGASRGAPPTGDAGGARDVGPGPGRQKFPEDCFDQNRTGAGTWDPSGRSKEGMPRRTSRTNWDIVTSV